jgi:hypothetical protein
MYVCMSFRPHTESPNYSSDIDTITYCYLTQLDTALCSDFSHDLCILNAYIPVTREQLTIHNADIICFPTGKRKFPLKKGT